MVVIGLAGPRSATADTLQLDARDLFAKSVTENVRLADDAGVIELERDELFEDDGPAAGYSYKPNEEKLSATIWIKKDFVLADARAWKATLLVGPGGELQGTVNGQTVKLQGAKKVGQYWQGYDVPVELLKGVAKRVIKLNVSAPFHCALMKPAQDRLALDLERLKFNEPTVPVITNVDARVTRTPDELRDALIRQVSAPVRWLESMQVLMLNRVETVVEVGPGKVLSGLMRQTNRDLKSLNVENAASLEAASAALAARDVLV